MNISELLKNTRQYFWSKDFSEIEIQYLNSSLPLEPNLYSFETTWRNLQTKYYLPTSPEYALKKHLSQEKTSCFAIGHCFRDLENSGPQHRPEFIMLEWYEVNKNLADVKQTTQDYISQFLDIKFTDLVLPTKLPNNEPDFNQWFLNEIEPTLPHNSGVFVSGYPHFLSPLAVPNQRFELYINGIEIANACVENRNPEQIKSAFEQEKIFRQKNNLPTHPYSQEFIDNCATLPNCSGIGLGLERLLMIINGNNSI